MKAFFENELGAPLFGELSNPVAEDGFALRRAKERLELGVRGSNVAIFDFEMPDGRIENSRPTLVNLWETLGHDPATAPSRLVEGATLAAHPEDLPRVQESIQSYLSGATKEFEVEYRVRHTNGSVLWRLARGVAVRDSKGKPVRFLGSLMEITHLKRVEAELEQARRTAECANRAKDEFLANVSHEIRTPMNAILGMTELALDSALTDHQTQLLTTVKSAATSLLGIIDGLLDFSKIEAGRLDLDLADFQLRASLGDTVRALATHAHRKGLELICHVHPDVPDAVVGDSGRLCEVILNLVGNAIKFTQSGEVVVEVATALLQTTDEGTADLVFTVRDTGIGIPREKHAAIFRPFEQEDSSTTRKYGGTGLGLTISSRLVELMGGTITVESEVGRGSTFRFTARFGRSTRSTPSGVVGARASLEGLRVLVVDDNATNRLVLDEWLGGWHMRSESVGDAASAMDALVRAAGRGEPFLLVLLDEGLQDTDGTTLASQISNRPGLGEARLILLSSVDSRFDIAHAREVGISACLLKPVQPSQLLETIAAVMNGSTADGTPALDRESMSPKPGPLPPTARLDVLVAEDNELNVVVLQEMLGRRGHRVHVATDGRAALAHAVGGAFDLLLLDVHMPQIDGFEVVRAIREYERGTEAYLPIIALTACSLGRDRERCLAAGMDGFLSKPVDPAALWAAISRVLSISPQPGPPGSRLIDSTVILLACGGQAGLLEKLRQGFRRSLPEHMAGARAAVRDHDLPHLCQAAHALHGTLAAFSTVAGSTASSLEDAANGGELDRCTALVKDLESMCSELLIETDTLTIDALTSC